MELPCQIPAQCTRLIPPTAVQRRAADGQGRQSPRRLVPTTRLSVLTSRGRSAAQQRLHLSRNQSQRFFLPAVPISRRRSACRRSSVTSRSTLRPAPIGRWCSPPAFPPVCPGSPAYPICFDAAFRYPDGGKRKHIVRQCDACSVIANRQHPQVGTVAPTEPPSPDGFRRRVRPAGRVSAGTHHNLRRRLR